MLLCFTLFRRVFVLRLLSFVAREIFSRCYKEGLHVNLAAWYVFFAIDVCECLVPFQTALLRNQQALTTTSVLVNLHPGLVCDPFLIAFPLPLFAAD